VRSSETALGRVVSDALQLWIEWEPADAIGWLAEMSAYHLKKATKGVSHVGIALLQDRVLELESDLLHAEEVREGEEEEARQQVEELVAEIDRLKTAVSQMQLNVQVVFRGNEVAHVCADSEVAGKRAGDIQEQGSRARVELFHIERFK
jgi:hypothetical protein